MNLRAAFYHGVSKIGEEDAFIENFLAKLSDFVGVVRSQDDKWIVGDIWMNIAVEVVIVDVDCVAIRKLIRKAYAQVS